MRTTPDRGAGRPTFRGYSNRGMRDMETRLILMWTCCMAWFTMIVLAACR